MRAAIYTSDAAEPLFADYLFRCGEWRLGLGTISIPILPGERPVAALERVYPGANILVLRGER